MFDEVIWFDRGSRLQLGDLNAATVLGEAVAVAPVGVEELGTLDDYLREMDTRAGGYLLGKDVDAGAQAEDQAGVFAIENDVATGKKDFSGGRHDDGPILSVVCHGWDRKSENQARVVNLWLMSRGEFRGESPKCW
jgi:hypothetical protein